MQYVDDLRKGDANRAGQRPGQYAQQLNDDPCWGVLKSLQHSLGGATVALRKIYCQTYLPRTYFAACLAHFAKVDRNGYAVSGGSIVPCKEVLKGTIRP